VCGLHHRESSAAFKWPPSHEAPCRSKRRYGPAELADCLARKQLSGTRQRGQSSRGGQGDPRRGRRRSAGGYRRLRPPSPRTGASHTAVRAQPALPPQDAETRRYSSLRGRTIFVRKNFLVLSDFLQSVVERIPYGAADHDEPARSTGCRTMRWPAIMISFPHTIT